MLRDQGTFTSAAVTASTLIVSGRGYLVSWSILVPGSASGTVYNFNAASGFPSSSALCLTGTTAGIFPAGVVFTSGLVVVPGTGQSVNVTYFLG